MSGYEGLRTRCAFIDLSRRGKIRVTGEDRARFLHAMSTNDIARLPGGSQLYAFFLNAQGRILADAWIYNRGDSFWLDTEPETSVRLQEHLDKYIIADDVTLENLTDSWAAIGIEGPESPVFLQSLDLGALPAEAFVVPVASTGEHGGRVFLPNEAKPILLEKLAAASLPQATAEEARVVRMENKRPRYGEEITERYLVQETDQLQAMHFNKGCYLGQEIVERVRSRGQVHRFLKPIRIEGRQAPAAGTKIAVNGKDSGEVVSAVWSPALGSVIGFAYLRGDALRPNAPLQITVDSLAQKASVRL